VNNIYTGIEMILRKGTGGASLYTAKNYFPADEFGYSNEDATIVW